jgi:hypothetical protein
MSFWQIGKELLCKADRLHRESNSVLTGGLAETSHGLRPYLLSAAL